MRARSLVPWILVAATASLSFAGAGFAPALAQAIKEPGWPPPEGAACKPSKKDSEEAHTLYQLGKNAHDTSNYTDAIKYYKDAYKRDCTAHVLLKNLGKVYEGDAQYAAAVEAYKMYLIRGKPTGEERDLIDAKITNLSKKASSTATDTATGTTTGTGTSTGTTTGTTTTTATATETATTTTSSTAPTSSATAPSGDGPGIAPWIVVGAGGVLLIGGGVFWISKTKANNDKADEFSKAGCSSPAKFPTPACQAIKSDGESAQTGRVIGATIFFVGVAAVGGGLAWALLGGGGGEKKHAHIDVQPSVGPGFAGIGVSGAF